MSDFAEDIVEELLERTSKGEQLTGLCTDPRMPKRSTVYRWLDGDEEFAGRFRAARARGVHALAEECLVIADEPAFDAVVVANKRVRIDTRLRLAGKWLSSEYGDKLAVSNETTVTHRHELAALSTEQLEAIETILNQPGHIEGGTGLPEPASVH